MLKENGRTCVDDCLDNYAECKLDADTLKKTCQCKDGYTLDADSNSCKAGMFANIFLVQWGIFLSLATITLYCG